MPLRTTMLAEGLTDHSLFDMHGKGKWMTMADQYMFCSSA
jgi:hypothetical protein